MSRRILLASICAICFLNSPAMAATINVNTTLDEYDVFGANETCSLREATVSANLDIAVGGCESGSGDDIINVPAGTYPLTRDCEEKNMALGTADPTPTVTPTVTPTATPTSSPTPQPTPDATYADGYCGSLVITGNTVVNGNGAIVDASAIGVDDIDLNSTGLGDSSGVDRVLTIFDPSIPNAAGVSAQYQPGQISSVVNDPYASPLLKALFAQAIQGADAAAAGAAQVYLPEQLYCDSCTAGIEVTINDLSFVGGAEFAGGGVLIDMVGCVYPVVTLVNTEFSGNKAEFLGGGIANFGEMHLVESTVDQNEAKTCYYCSTSGGGVFSATIPGCVFTNSIEDSTVSNNQAAFGAGVANVLGELSIEDSVISGNFGKRPDFYSAAGGGVLNAGLMSITNTQVIGNEAAANSYFGEGGGIMNGVSLFRVSGSDVPKPNYCDNIKGFGDDDDDDDDDFSGISCQISLAIDHSVISGNRATHAGGIANYADMTIEFSTIDANTADIAIGGIANYGTHLYSYDYYDCATAAAGTAGCGPELVQVLGSLEIDSSTISNNKAPYVGGMLSAIPAVLRNTTISGNIAYIGGAGGLLAADAGQTQLIPVGEQEIPVPNPLPADGISTYNCTITNNSVDTKQTVDDALLEIDYSAPAQDEPVFENQINTLDCRYLGITAQVGGYNQYSPPAGGGVGVVSGNYYTANTILSANKDGQACSFAFEKGAQGPGGSKVNPDGRDIYILPSCGIQDPESVGAQYIGYDEQQDQFCYYNYGPDSASQNVADIGFYGAPAGISRGYNFIGDNTGGEAFQDTTGDKIGTGADPLDALLGELDDNGGVTLTHLPLQGSPVIDMGNPDAVSATEALELTPCLGDDQREVVRPVDGDQDTVAVCDIGSVEVNGPCGKPGDFTCLGCEDVDISATQFFLDGGILQLKNITRQAAKYLKRQGKKRKAAKIIADAQALYLEGWGLSWSIPSVFTSCTNKSFCVSTDNTATINSVTNISQELFDLLESTVNKLKNINTTVKRIKKKLLRKGLKVHNENLSAAAKIPATAEDCV